MFTFLKPSGRGSSLARPALLLLLLLLLHAALLQGPLTLAGKALLLGHFGAVLLWQPLVSGEREFSPAGTLVLVLVLGVLGVFLSWGVLMLWGLVLVGIFGGKVFHHPTLRVRLSYWLALMYVVVALVGLMLPQMLAGVAELPTMLRSFAAWFALPVCGLIAVLGLGPAPERESAEVDVVGAVVLVLVVMGVLLGALAFMFVAGSDYLTALLQALGSMALTLLLLALVWGPHRGFAGLGLEVSRRLLGGGQTFELWLREVADLALREDLPEALVAAALARLATWRGVCGLSWQARPDDGSAGSGLQRLGSTSLHVTRLTHGALQLEVFTEQALTPTAAWQFDLMLRILAEFHAAKLQAQRLQALSFLRAVHETGARTTHEIKNLLQSLDMLCHAVLTDDGRDPVAVQALLGQQLPAIRERLNEAMLSIRQPRPDDLRPQPLLRWWAALQARHVDARIEYVLEGELAGVSVPAALFDCVADNLLRNAQDKQASVIRVRVQAAEKGCSLTVMNDGVPIEEARAARLFVQPLASDSGLGIGLYQASRLAESAGYRLTLDENAASGVSFGLRPK
ncbi:hypothetical protein GCM10027046_16000 [Uliginosibacterium flavum]|uniref:ATP-binding protein n=1 Tax=Uliginosibacterium flavum TaxID=1396831 RepID=A0ABV2TR45_9RHOO